MASTRVRPTPPPSGPALVRPAVGALLLTLSGMACGGDDTSNDSANASEPPMVASEDGPMPNPTTSEPPMVASEDGPMPNPTTGATESADTGSSTDGGGNTEEPPMPPTTGDSSGSSGSSGSDSGSTGPIPPMPPPDGGPVHEDDQEI
jgi:hypothetical protein